MQAATSAQRFGPSPDRVGMPAYCFTVQGPHPWPRSEPLAPSRPCVQCCRPAVEITGYDVGGPGPEPCPAPHWWVTARSGFSTPTYKMSSGAG